MKFLTVVPIGRGNPAPTKTVGMERLLSSGSKAARQGEFYRRIYYRTGISIALLIQSLNLFTRLISLSTRLIPAYSAGVFEGYSTLLSQLMGFSVNGLVMNRVEICGRWLCRSNISVLQPPRCRVRDRRPWQRGEPLPNSRPLPSSFRAGFRRIPPRQP